MTMLNKALELIQNTQTPVDVIAKSTGISTRWLYEFRAGNFTDPGSEKVEAVYDYLKRRK